MNKNSIFIWKWSIYGKNWFEHQIRSETKKRDSLAWPEKALSLTYMSTVKLKEIKSKQLITIKVTCWQNFSKNCTNFDFIQSIEINSSNYPKNFCKPCKQQKYLTLYESLKFNLWNSFSSVIFLPFSCP